jgi:glycosyltransferase involved in cell wall biosynthesis
MDFDTAVSVGARVVPRIPRMTGVGLHMIVKDEAHVIERCLRSVRPYVDWWVVSDTGSTDGTQGLVRDVMAGLPGLLIERPWVSFGHNRGEALEAARSLDAARPGDYALWIDADDVLVGPATWPELTADGYQLEVEYGGTRFSRLHLVRLDRPWRWTGAVHEHLDLAGATTASLAAPKIVQHHDGARSRDPQTYLKDAALLETELRARPDDARTQFYLAQSWRDAGELERALAAYRVRAANPHGWDQERWYALFQVAVLLERLDASAEQVAEAYLTAFQARPDRAEPLVELARFERGRERYDVALLYGRAATRIGPPPRDALFVDAGAHTWRSWDEVAVSSYWAGQYAEGVVAARKALDVRPDDPRLQENLAWCQAGLGAT